jgi:hypothetical protein
MKSCFSTLYRKKNDPGVFRKVTMTIRRLSYI